MSGEPEKYNFTLAEGLIMKRLRYQAYIVGTAKQHSVFNKICPSGPEVICLYKVGLNSDFCGRLDLTAEERDVVSRLKEKGYISPSGHLTELGKSIDITYPWVND